MNRITSIFAVVGVLIAASTQAQRPVWNDEQTQIWTFVEQSWVDDAAENDEWPADYVHDQYVAWSDSNHAPYYRDESIAWNRFVDENSNTLWYEISPAAIVVKNDTAVVYYHSMTITEDSSGNSSRDVNGIVEVLVRDGRGWKYLSSTTFESKLND